MSLCLHSMMDTCSIFDDNHCNTHMNFHGLSSEWDFLIRETRWRFLSIQNPGSRIETNRPIKKQAWSTNLKNVVFVKHWKVSDPGVCPCKCFQFFVELIYLAATDPNSSRNWSISKCYWRMKSTLQLDRILLNSEVYKISFNFYGWNIALAR